MNQENITSESSLKYFHYSKLRRFCNILSLSDVWMDVAANIPNRKRSGPRFTLEEINQLLNHTILYYFKSRSNPAEEVLKAWMTDNVTFKDLIEVLQESNFLRGITFLKDNVLSDKEPPSQKNDETSLIINYETVNQWTNNFDRNNYIASGGFADVFQGRKSGQLLAVKRFKKLNQDLIKMFENEVSVLNTCDHPNLLKMLHYSTDVALCLVYEYMDNGSLYDYLADKNKISSLFLSDRVSIAEQTASGLAYLHSQNIVHRDIKSSNILLQKDMVTKIGDFGITKIISDHNATHVLTSTLIGTTIYMAYEYLLNREVSTKIDMYSFGVVLVELLKGIPAFDENRKIRNILDIIEDDYDPDPVIVELESFECLKNLSLKLLSKQKKNRPSAEETKKMLNMIRMQIPS